MSSRLSEITPGKELGFWRAQGHRRSDLRMLPCVCHIRVFGSRVWFIFRASFVLFHKPDVGDGTLVAVVGMTVGVGVHRKRNMYPIGRWLHLLIRPLSVRN